MRTRCSAKHYRFDLLVMRKSEMKRLKGNALLLLISLTLTWRWSESNNATSNGLISGNSSVDIWESWRDAKTGCHCDHCSCCLTETVDCKHYCVCVQNKPPKHRPCPGDLVFNADIQNCDLPENTICPTRPPPPAEFKCPNENGIYKNVESCKNFIQCANWYPFIHFCPADLFFCEHCPQGPRCDYEHVANCTTKPTTTAPRPSTVTNKPNITASITHSIPDQSTEPPTTTSPFTERSTLPSTGATDNPVQPPTPKPTPSPEFKCTTKEGLYKNPKNCSTYIQCAHWKPHIQSCPLTLVFCEHCNPPRCDYDDIANCREEPSTRKIFNPENLTSKTTVDGIRVSRSVFTCPSFYGFFENPTNPNAYFKCIEGIPTEYFCPKKLIYNHDINACALPNIDYENDIKYFM